MKKQKLLVITASPRRNSNSTAAAKNLSSTLAKKYDAEFVDINKLVIKPCIACDKCADGVSCNIKDDAPGLIDRVKEADAVLVASPVYFTGVPAPLKAFIDRNQGRWYEWKKSPKSGVRNPKLKPGYIVLTSGADKKRWFAPAESEIRSFFAVNNIRSKKTMRLGSMDKEGSFVQSAISKQQTAIKKGNHVR